MVSTSISGEGRKFNGKTLTEWDNEWVEMEGGFSITHPSLHGYIGLFCAELNGEIKLIGAATEFNNGGFSKRLQTIRSNVLQSGNNHASVKFIRGNIDILTLKVIKIGKGAGLELIIVEIKKAMMKKYHLKTGKIGRQQ